MDTKHFKKILVLICCVTLVVSSVGMSAFCVNAEETAVNPQPTTQEATDPVQDTQPEKTAAEKKAEEKAKKKAATKKNQQKIVKFARKQLGKKYRYGSFGPNTFDCIGLVYYVFRNAGAKLKTSMTRDKACHMKKSFGKYIVSHNPKKAKAGDIIIFYSGNHVKHACIAIGNGKCINASKSGVKVKKIPSYAGCKVGVVRIVK